MKTASVTGNAAPHADGSVCAILVFRAAAERDVEAIVTLVNSAYRGESSRAGWTTEADLLAGVRTDVGEIQQLISGADSLILLGLEGDTLLASVHLARAGMAAHLGMFAVNPRQQARGLGKALLSAAEAEVQRRWQCSTMRMHVISVRTELIAFYARRGYRATGNVEPFPVNPALWQPKPGAATLRLIEMEKSLSNRQ